MSTNGLQELQKYMAVSKYARWVKDLKRRETWAETGTRYRDMLVRKYPGRANEINRVCARIEPFDVLPSMRGLQFGGDPVFHHNARMYNCTGSFCDRLSFFGEAFYLLLTGSGVGFSVQHRHIQHLPAFSAKRIAGEQLPKKTFKVPDKIEGWADCAHVLTSSYSAEPVPGFEEYHNCEVVFDYSEIREANSELSFGIGRAPGPMPLRKAIERVRQLLNKAIASGLTKFDSITAYDVMMYFADAVVSGGVRRSATIVLFDLWDEAMLNSKTGNWRATNPQRGRSNNSAILIRGKTTWEEFHRLFAATKEFGEPGFYWTDHPDQIPNPCVEIGFWPMLQLGELGLAEFPKYRGPVYEQEDGSFAISGWQMCNLTSINGKTLRGNTKAERVADFHSRCRDAALLGTWQAGFADFPYLGEVSGRIVRREALLGVSICGTMHHPDVLLDPEVLREGAAIVLLTNEGEAFFIGINPCARATCQKPDGNLGATLGAFSGCHGGKFRKGMRLAQANKMEAPYQHFNSVNPQACEPSVWSVNGTDDVVRFCVEYDGVMEADMTAVEFLGHVKTLYENWVVPGKVESRCTKKWLSHNISNTVRVRDDEWDGVAKQIFDCQDSYSGVSFISVSGDRDYPQAPFTSVYTPEEQQQAYELDELGHELVDCLVETATKFGFRDIWDASDLVLRMWASDREPTYEQKAWGGAVLKLADRYFGGDVKKTTYCIKDKHNWELYLRLKESYRPVDYALMVEESNGVNLTAEVACGGGACEM